jgi:CMP-N-acetylneuraminic acid synthetase
MAIANILALIPARKNSRGIPGKNFKQFAGFKWPTCVMAADVAIRAGCQAVISTDADLGPTEPYGGGLWPVKSGTYAWLCRPPELAQDDTPMLAVVQHALAQIPGPSDQIICLLQPTQPLRQPRHILAAIALLQSSGADSVVSVVETRSPDEILEIFDGRLKRVTGWSLCDCPTRRQGSLEGYWRDGTVYAFWRKTADHWGDIYGQDVCPLIISAEETCALDSPADWAEAERRLRA